jgi:hypothetical protein
VRGHYVAYAKRAVDGLYGLAGLEDGVKTMRGLNLMEYDRFICPHQYRDGQRVSSHCPHQDAVRRSYDRGSLLAGFAHRSSSTLSVPTG